MRRTVCRARTVMPGPPPPSARGPPTRPRTLQRIDKSPERSKMTRLGDSAYRVISPYCGDGRCRPAWEKRASDQNRDPPLPGGGGISRRSKAELPKRSGTRHAKPHGPRSRAHRRCSWRASKSLASKLEASGFIALHEFENDTIGGRHPNLGLGHLSAWTSSPSSGRTCERFEIVQNCRKKSWLLEPV